MYFSSSVHSVGPQIYSYISLILLGVQQLALIYIKSILVNLCFTVFIKWSKNESKL